MIPESQKESIRKEARAILDKFAKSLDKVMENSVDYVTAHSNSPDREFGTKSNPIIQILCKVPDKTEQVKGDGTRKEGDGLKGDEDFRERMFANAPNKSEDCIVAEKGAWAS
ncbi:MAG: hypothetical protein AABX12_03650 [Nanoarchaeota archaeon]